MESRDNFVWNGHTREKAVQVKCPKCKGIGEVIGDNEKCPFCDGHGEVWKAADKSNLYRSPFSKEEDTKIW